MRRQENQFATPAVTEATRHLGELLRQARLSRGWSLSATAERARVSTPTLSRMERGGTQTALGAWLAVFEVLGLLHLFAKLDDPGSRAVLDATRARDPRAVRDTDLDF